MIGGLSIVVALIVVAYVLVMPLLAYLKARQAVREMQYMRKRMAEDRNAMRINQATPSSAPAGTRSDQPTPVPAKPASVSPPPAVMETTKPISSAVPPVSHTASPSSSSRTQKASMFSGWEITLGSNWSVWAGAAALTIGAVMLVKYMIDVGALSPLVRCVLGMVFGGVLIGGGEYIHHKGWVKPIPGLPMASVPEAIVSAGVAAMYASVFVAFGVYELLGAGLAFAALAAVSVGALSLSLRHGILLALVGSVGAYVVPALVQTGAPSVFGLFGYLTIVTLACQGVVRYRGWVHIQTIPIMATAVWFVIWFTQAGQARMGLDADLVIPFYAALVLLSGNFAHSGIKETHAAPLLNLPWSVVVDIAASVVAGIAVFAQVRISGYDLSSVLASSVPIVAMMVLARWDERLIALPFWALAVVGGLIASWDTVRHGLRLIPDYGQNVALIDTPVVVVVGAVFMVLGAVAVWFVKWPPNRPVQRPGLWSALSALAPVVMIGAGYARSYILNIEGPWLQLAVGMAVLNGALAFVLYRRGAETSAPTIVAAYALGALAAMCLAAAIPQNEIWFNVALSLTLPGVAWLSTRLKIANLQIVLGSVGVFILLRLLWHPFVLSDLRAGVMDLWWVLPAYAVPSAMFALAVRLIGTHGHKTVREILNVGSAAFALMMITAASRLTMGPGTGQRDLAYLEAAVHTASWLGMAYAFYFGDRSDGTKDGLARSGVVTWAWRFLAVLGLASAFFGPIWAHTIMPYGLRVGDTPFFNTLFVAFCVPGIIAILFARTARARGQHILLKVAGGAALVLLFIYVNLSVRHLYHGSEVMVGFATDAEIYTYSMAWIMFAGAMMAYGMVRVLPALRILALGLMALSACKVVLVDMDTLTGLYRALSFLGLGAALIGLGFAYQRIARAETKGEMADA